MRRMDGWMDDCLFLAYYNSLLVFFFLFFSSLSYCFYVYYYYYYFFTSCFLARSLSVCLFVSFRVCFLLWLIVLS
ncbi:hypothetical protein BD289DRAFT_448235 [Coniella lustricola]|uniref:Uncharacterized protein n=1 Tax=Coniella lustricola TaxID=2025994 RepID=A0A2T2ZSC7_9PEZI|nr:hypothetical protein BD289DRAFT_448235 [Coniella lustricola]